MAPEVQLADPKRINHPGGWLRSLLTLAICGWFGHVHGQFFAMSNGSVSTCSGAFLDSGGQGASGYGDSEDLTYTICPDNPGDAISLNFITFTLDVSGVGPIDAMTIHDGNSTAAPMLGTWTGTALQGSVITASLTNTTGCLTVVFNSNETGTGVFAASITCFEPCARPTALATHGLSGPLRICPGENVTFNSSASFAEPGFAIASRRWEFGDGSFQNNAPVNASHTYAQEGAYIAQLFVTDDNGCTSANRVDLVVMVGTEPNFIGTTGDLVGCVGEELCLDGIANPRTWVQQPDPNLGGGVFLPDNVGECFTSELTFNQFAPGQTMTSVNNIQGICLDMEHSFIGDLVISIISPTGETVIMHQQGGAGTYLGVPVDIDSQPLDQGTCWNYCWSPTSNNGTWADNASATLPSGTYESLNPLNGLIGSQLNGTWTIRVCDLWASDNGFICNWGIDFDPALFDDLLVFTPVIGADCDSSSWSGPNISSTSADCNSVCLTPTAAGNFNYVYTVTDNHGCTYDTTLTVTVVAPRNAGLDGSLVLCATAPNSNLFNALNGAPQGGGTWTGPTGASSATFNPGTSPPGIYTYTVTGTEACQTRSAVVEVTVVEPEDPGADTTLTLCSTGPNLNLFNRLGGDPDPGGSWTGPDGLNVGNMIDPSLASAGTYTYTLGDNAPCPAVAAIIEVDILEPPDAGLGDTLTVCSIDAPLDLFDLLGGSPDVGGSWIGPSTVVNDQFDPATMNAGNYRYRVTGTSPCPDLTSIIRILVNDPPDPGTNGALTLCTNGAPQPLMDELGGSPEMTGTWSGPSVVTAGVYDPLTMNAGDYTYTVSGPEACPDRSAVVNVVEVSAPNAGLDGILQVCPENSGAALFPELEGTPQSGGTWSAPDGSLTDDTFEAQSEAIGMYRYVVWGQAPCAPDTAEVAVSLHPLPLVDAGYDGLTCTLGSEVHASGNFASGIWTGPASVTFSDATSPSTQVFATVGGDVDLQWSATSVDGCAGADSVRMTFTEELVPVTNVSDPICFGGCSGVANLSASGGNSADGTYGYQWTSGLTGQLPEMIGLCAGEYTFEVTDDNGCSAVASFTLNDPEPADIDALLVVDETCPGTCDGRIMVVDPAGARYSLDQGSTYQAQPVFGPLCPGQYVVWMEDEDGCLAVDPATIVSPPPVLAGFTMSTDTVFLSAPMVEFYNTSSTNATRFVWDMGDGRTEEGPDPVHSFPAALGDRYTVCLTAYDANNCPDSVCAPIEVLDVLLAFVPNAFSPNGDGNNEGFGPVFNIPWVKDYTFLVFDRWGEELFASTVVGGQWDGTYGGQPAKPDVYVWKLACTDALTGEPAKRPTSRRSRSSR
jgi:gliding motility-associated-like protein